VDERDPLSGLAGARTPADAGGWLRLITDHTPDIIMTLDRDAKIRFINRTLPQFSVEQVLGTSALDYLPREDAERFRPAFEDVLASKEPRSIEVSSVGPTWWLTRMIPIPHEERVESVLLIATEITERKNSEEALKQSESRFRTLAETTTAAIFIFQGEQIVYANRAAELITGYTVSELVQNRFWDVIHPDHREVVKARGMEQQQGGDVPRRYEVKLVTKSGEERWVDYAGSLFDLGGSPAVVGTAVDVTERKKAEEQRRLLEAQVHQAQKLESLGALAGGLAHDFNNLLTGILGSASLASMKIPPDSPAKEQIARILVAAEKAAELTRKMLAYAGKGQFSIGPTDVNAITEEVLPLVRSTIGRNIALKLALAPNLPSVEADGTQLQQIVVNLVTNASEAIGAADGEIVLRTGAMTGPEGASVFLEVRDDGPGMDEGTKKRIFDPFFTTKFTGRGLGLAAVQGIVRVHGGSIQVESAPRRGTTFTVLIPAAGQRPKPDAGASGERARPRATGTILVVDDEESVRSVARHSLEERGYEVLTASDGESAVELFEERVGSIDAVLLDVVMPRMSGEETLDALKRLKADVRVVLTSGHGERDVASRFDRRGLAGFMQKPFRPEELVHRIEEALAGD
jgi:PAS domain S-box-containing protein